jgi:hypothetical protein
MLYTSLTSKPLGHILVTFRLLCNDMTQSGLIIDPSILVYSLRTPHLFDLFLRINRAVSRS